ncbi:MAG: DUF2156 domain-containing protein [Desulfuromonadaceae bacterium]|nr:DUF2156 domain-containing protein [Desulfuromonadaceae bacterium]
MEIPAYPVSRPLLMADKPVLDRICADLQPRVSELTFAGLYLFRAAHDYRVTQVGDSTVLLGKGYDEAPYFLPPLGGDVNRALTVLFSDKLLLYGADEKFAKMHLSGGSIIISEDRDSFDYLYLREELATLPGNRFHKKKNRINYFTTRHHYEVAIYSDHFCKGCLALLDTWSQFATDETDKSLHLEVEATYEALNLAGELGLEGVVILVDGSIAAFALGERLNLETSVCHFEKAGIFMEGLSQLVNREFASRLFTDCPFLNREQDLGEPGLRNAKLSYHPVELVKKYRATSSS